MRIGKLDVSVQTTPKLDDHVLIKLDGSKYPGCFTIVDGELRLRLTLETAIKLSQYIDDSLIATNDEAVAL